MRSQPYYSTQFGRAYLGDAFDVLSQLPAESVDLIVTSPPFPLTFRKKKPYTSVGEDGFIAWFLPYAEQCRRLLRETGSLVIDLGGVWNKGTPTKSLYQHRLVIRRDGPTRCLKTSCSNAYTLYVSEVATGLSAALRSTCTSCSLQR